MKQTYCCCLRKNICYMYFAVFFLYLKIALLQHAATLYHTIYRLSRLIVWPHCLIIEHLRTLLTRSDLLLCASMKYIEILRSRIYVSLKPRFITYGSRPTHLINVNENVPTKIYVFCLHAYHQRLTSHESLVLLVYMFFPSLIDKRI